MRVSVELSDSIGTVPLSWWLGDDLRDVADYACCAGAADPHPPLCRPRLLISARRPARLAKHVACAPSRARVAGARGKGRKGRLSVHVGVRDLQSM